jgi:hypothetical protein
MKNLTTEVAEHAEEKMTKGSKPRDKGKTGPISNASLKAKTAKGLSWNDLCALCLLPSHLLVFNSGGYRKREILFPKIRE